MKNSPKTHNRFSLSSGCYGPTDGQPGGGTSRRGRWCGGRSFPSSLSPLEQGSVQGWYIGRSMADGKILSYSDVILRESDLHILSGRHFLNDRIIEFYFGYISSHYHSDEILLAPPAITFWISNCTDKETVRVFVEPLNFSSRNLVIFAVNDNEDVTRADGGCHWSLLAFERSHNIFVHHDSLGGMNAHHAKRLYRSVLGFMACSEPAKYVEYDASPRQLNGYDCGLFVTAIARTMCSWYMEKTESKEQGGDRWFLALKEQVTPSAVSEMRLEIHVLIKQLIASK